VVCEPAENDEAGSGDGAQPEEEEFGVVCGYAADVGLREGRLVVVILGLPVDEDEAEDDADCDDGEEGGGRE
jgi:hypothetical protein